jgi:Zn-dependent protease
MLESWIGVYVLLTVATLIHELGHVVACRKYGGEVHEVGFLVYMLQPAWFSNVNDAWLMPRRRDRIVVSLAGVYFEAFLWCVCVAVWYFARPFSLVGQTGFVLAFLLAARIAFNLIPILRLDGYWVLSDVLAMPNLRPRAFAFLLSRVPRFGEAWRPTRPLARKEAAVFTVYGSLSLIMAAAAVVTTVWSAQQVLVHAFPSYGHLIVLAVMAVFIAVAISSAVRYVSGLRGGIW